MNSKFGFWLRRPATKFEPACIAQLIQVELLRRQLRLIQTLGARFVKNEVIFDKWYNLICLLKSFFFAADFYRTHSTTLLSGLARLIRNCFAVSKNRRKKLRFFQTKQVTQDV